MSKEHSGEFSGNDLSRNEKARDLCNEWERQIAKYLKLGFHKQRGLTIEEYMASIPGFQLPSGNLMEYFNRLLLVEPRIPSQKQLRLAGYKYSVRGTAIDNVITDTNPYVVLLQDGSKKELGDPAGPDERCVTLQEGASLLLSYPEILDSHPVVILGSTVFSFEGNEVQRTLPCIYRWSDDKIGIGSDHIGYLADYGAKPATCAVISKNSTLLM